jgi:hypothetical protein
MKARRYQTKNGYDHPMRCVVITVDGHDLWYAHDVLSWTSMITAVARHIIRKRLAKDIDPKAISIEPIVELDPSTYRDMINTMDQANQGFKPRFGIESEISLQRSRNKYFHKASISRINVWSKA